MAGDRIQLRQYRRSWHIADGMRHGSFCIIPDAPREPPFAIRQGLVASDGEALASLFSCP